jgi:TorA maturation chaperone TorD
LEETFSELKEYLSLRQKIYSILGYAFYKEADENYLKELGRYASVFEEMYKINENADLIQGLEYLRYTPDEDVSFLRKQYARLFLSTGYAQKLKSIIPQESVYLSPNHLSMQDQRDEVLEIYYNEGIGKNKDFREPDDHITAEFHFMAQLSEKTIEYMESEPEIAKSKLEVQLNFLDLHILKWVPAVCSDIMELTTTNYFKAIAKLTNGFVETDRETISAVLY